MASLECVQEVELEHVAPLSVFVRRFRYGSNLHHRGPQGVVLGSIDQGNPCWVPVFDTTM